MCTECVTALLCFGEDVNILRAGMSDYKPNWLDFWPLHYAV